MRRTFSISLFAALVALPWFATPARADDRARLIDDAKPYLTLTSYRAHMTTTVNGTAHSRTFEFVAPDRVRVSGDGPMSDLVSIGSKSWMKVPGQGWTASPMGIGAMVGSMRDPANIAKLSKDMHQTVTFKGNGSWHGLPAHLYETTSSFAGYASHATIYVMPDHYVHHVETTSSHGSTSIDYTDFNSKSISIQPPV